MKNKAINQAALDLKQKMLTWWQVHRKSGGFGKACEQMLYDALCEYCSKETRGRDED